MTRANNGTGNNPSRDMWETPQELWDQLNQQYHFSFDCCASRDNSKCVRFSSYFEDEFAVDNISWMNPPFSIADRMFKHFFKVIKNGVAIYRCDNFETKLWQEIIFPNADWIFIPNKRVAYEGMDGNGSRFQSALNGVGVDIPKGLDGTLLRVNRGGECKGEMMVINKNCIMCNGTGYYISPYGENYNQLCSLCDLTKEEKKSSIEELEKLEYRE